MKVGRSRRDDRSACRTCTARSRARSRATASTDVLVRVETDDGAVGWGEACSGADARVGRGRGPGHGAVRGRPRPVEPRGDARRPVPARPVAVPRGHGQLRVGGHRHGAARPSRQERRRCPSTACSAGCGAAEVSYFYYLARGERRRPGRAVRAPAWRRATRRFYLKVGVDAAEDLRDGRRHPRGARARARGCGSTPTAAGACPRRCACSAAMAEHDIDFVEQPVRDHPVGQLAEVRARLPMAVCANEGLWSEADAYARITARQADVYCFSPYWVGLARGVPAPRARRALEGLQVCKHTHGELGLAAAASPARAADAAEHRRGAPADGADDGVRHRGRAACRSPTRRSWGVPEGVGPGRRRSSEDRLREGARRYELDGQFLPYQPRAAGPRGARPDV